MKLLFFIIFISLSVSQEKLKNTLSVGFFSHLNTTSLQYQRYFNNNSILIGMGGGIKRIDAKWSLTGFQHFGNWDIGVGIFNSKVIIPIFFTYGYKIKLDKYYSIRLGGDILYNFMVPLNIKFSVSF